LIPPWVLGAGLLLACVALGRPVLAQEAWLEWTAPPECQNTSEVERRLQSLLGRPVDFEAIPPTRVRMAWRAETGWAVRVTVALPSGPRDRALDAPSCADALDVVALSLALILDPDFVPAEPVAVAASEAEQLPEGDSHLVGVVLDPVPAAEASESSGVGSTAPAATLVDQRAAAEDAADAEPVATVAFGGAAKVDLTTFPVPQFGGGAQLGVRLRAFRIEAEGSLLASESASLQGAEERVSFASLVGGLRACFVPNLTSQLAWAMCAGAELGSLSTQELGGRARQESGLWLASQLLMGPEFSATRWLRAFAHAKGVTPLIRHDFLLSEGSRVHEFPWLGFQFEVGFSMDVTELGEREH
jgi:hypothetical protein